MLLLLKLLPLSNELSLIHTPTHVRACTHLNLHFMTFMQPFVCMCVCREGGGGWMHCLLWGGGAFGGGVVIRWEATPSRPSPTTQTTDTLLSDLVLMSACAHTHTYAHMRAHNCMCTRLLRLWLMQVSGSSKNYSHDLNHMSPFFHLGMPCWSL